MRSLAADRLAILEGVFAATGPEALKDNLGRLPPHFLMVDGNSPGPLDAIEKLRASGYLEEVFRSGKMSVLRRKS